MPNASFLLVSPQLIGCCLMSSWFALIQNASVRGLSPLTEFSVFSERIVLPSVYLLASPETPVTPSFAPELVRLFTPLVSKIVESA
jgi:hypothetical protein